MDTQNTNISFEQRFENEQKFIELVESWQNQVVGDNDFGYIDCEFTNSVYAEKCYEWGHYGYSRREHRSIQERFDLDYNNAVLVKYTVRQSDFALGPSSDIHSFISAGLSERGYMELGTTSDDEYGTHLTYWYLLELGEPAYNPNYDPDEDEEPYDRWDDPYGDEDY